MSRSCTAPGRCQARSTISSGKRGQEAQHLGDSRPFRSLDNCSAYPRHRTSRARHRPGQGSPHTAHARPYSFLKPSALRPSNLSTNWIVMTKVQRTKQRGGVTFHVFVTLQVSPSWVHSCTWSTSIHIPVLASSTNSPRIAQRLGDTFAGGRPRNRRASLSWIQTANLFFGSNICISPKISLESTHQLRSDRLDLSAKFSGLRPIA